MTPHRFVCACATARTVARTLTQLYDGVLRDAGIEAPQFALLMALEAQGPTKQAAIGRLFALDKTTLSRNLRWLERQGWIAAAPAADRRERQFAVTADGRRRLADAKVRWTRAQAMLRSEMGDADWRAMCRLFGRIIDAADRAKRRSITRPAARGSDPRVTRGARAARSRAT